MMPKGIETARAGRVQTRIVYQVWTMNSSKAKFFVTIVRKVAVSIWTPRRSRETKEASGFQVSRIRVVPVPKPSLKPLRRVSSAEFRGTRVGAAGTGMTLLLDNDSKTVTAKASHQHRRASRVPVKFCQGGVTAILLQS